MLKSSSQTGLLYGVARVTVFGRRDEIALYVPRETKLIRKVGKIGKKMK